MYYTTITPIEPTQSSGAPSADVEHRVCFPPPQEGMSMQRYVHKENIILYRKLLAETMDEEKRKIIAKLLADEEAKETPSPSQEK
jgi:hypothetical protein